MSDIKQPCTECGEYDCRTYEEQLEEALKIAKAENERLRAQPCPHVITSKEGTSYCQLAEKNAGEFALLRAENERLRSDYAALEAFIGPPKADLTAEIRLMRPIVEAADSFDQAREKKCEVVRGYKNAGEIEEAHAQAEICLLGLIAETAEMGLQIAVRAYRKAKEAA